MRQLVLLIVFAAFATVAKCQQFEAGVTYQYLSVTQWDRAVQIYNASRPYLTEYQPLFKHGLQVGGSWFFLQGDRQQYGATLRYSRHESHAENPGNDVSLGVNIIEAGVRFRFLFKVIEDSTIRLSPGFYADLNPTLGAITLGRKVNGERAENDDRSMFSVGPMLGVGLRFGHQFGLGEQNGISPFVGIQYDLLVGNTSHEVLINQRELETLRDQSDAVRWQAGVSVQF